MPDGTYPRIDLGSLTQEESGRRSMVVNSNLKSDFTALTVYSSLLFILFSITTFHLVTRRNEMLGSPGGLGAAYGSEYTPFGDGPDSQIPQKRCKQHR